MYGALVQLGDNVCISDPVPSGPRSDGRSLQELRPLFLRLGILSQAPGSAYYESAGTKLFAAVYGPRPVAGPSVTSGAAPDNGAEVFVEVKFAAFASPLQATGSVSEVERDVALKTGRAIRAAVRRELYPKTQIEVFIFVVQDDGGVASAAATASSLALADAGVECKDMFVGCQVAQVSSTHNDFAIDPTFEEAKSASAALSFIVLVNTEALIGLDATAGQGTTPGDINDAATLAKGGTRQIAKLMRTALARSVTKSNRSK